MLKRLFTICLAFFWFAALVLRFVPTRYSEQSGALLFAALIFSVFYLFFYLLHAQVKGKDVFAERRESDPDNSMFSGQVGSDREANATTVFESRFGSTPQALVRNYLALWVIAFLWLNLKAGSISVEVDPAVLASNGLNALYAVTPVILAIGLFFHTRIEFHADSVVAYSLTSFLFGFGRKTEFTFQEVELREGLVGFERYVRFRSHGKWILVVRKRFWKSYLDLRREACARSRPSQIKINISTLEEWSA